MQGEYRILAKELDFRVRAIGPPSFTDYDLRVQARYQAGTAGKAYGVVFRYVDSDNYYEWWVNPTSGSYRLRKKVVSERNTLRGWGKSALIEPRNEPMGLRMVAQGSDFKFYVDGSLIFNHADTSFASGRVGVMALNDVDLEGAEMFFDNLRVFGLK